MAEHNELGSAGEDAAVAYLDRQGYAIRHRNWRRKHLEIDVVAVHDDEVVFIEVKTRKNDNFGDPYGAVDEKKMRYLMMAADTYVKLYQIDKNIRFDIISVTGTSTQNFKIEHIQDAFYPTSTNRL